MLSCAGPKEGPRKGTQGKDPRAEATRPPNLAGFIRDGSGPYNASFLTLLTLVGRSYA